MTDERMTFIAENGSGHALVEDGLLILFLLLLTIWCAQ